MRLIDYAALFVIGLLLASVVALAPRAVRDDRPPHQSPASIQELPDALVNAPPDRLAGPDGYPLVDHSAGW